MGSVLKNSGEEQDHHNFQNCYIQENLVRTAVNWKCEEVGLRKERHENNDNCRQSDTGNEVNDAMTTKGKYDIDILAQSACAYLKICSSALSSSLGIVRISWTAMKHFFKIPQACYIIVDHCIHAFLTTSAI